MTNLWTVRKRVVYLVCVAIVAGATCLWSTGVFSAPKLTADDTHVAAAKPVPRSTTPVRTTKPTRLIIPSLDLALTIHDATINEKTNEWPLSDTEAEYANFTAKLGETRGTLLLYGHNQWQVLRKTAALKFGDRMILLDAAGGKWQFEYYRQQVIDPHDTAFVTEDVPFRVVMFTCDGWNDSARRLMYFRPVAQHRS